jgi:uncharacterized protein
MRGDSRHKFMPRRINQGGGDVGARMKHIFRRQGRGPTIIIGSDIPSITREMIADAFLRLASADAIFGPAEDGGYWLVGFQRYPGGLSPFANVRWSTEHALADTLRNLASYRVAFAEALFDIDTAADYRRYLRERYR